MNRLVTLLLWFLFPVASFAQDGNHFLRETTSMLAINQRPQSRFYVTEHAEIKRLDTLTRNARNDFFRSLNYLWRGEYEQAISWMDQTASRYPKESGSIGELYLTYLHDYHRALACFNTYDALTPGFDDIIAHSPVSYYRGLAYQHLGDHRQAVGQFSVAIDSLAHKHGSEWVNYRHFVSRAMSYLSLSQPEKALADLDNALKNYNKSALAQYHKGRALLQLNRLAEARTAFQDAGFFVKALRASHSYEYQEDERNPLYESQIDEALAHLKTLSR